jgi:carbon-monoxide dehydrogenase iron sulfur subunit
MKKGFVFIYGDKCLACKTCELSCAVSHSNSKELFKSINEMPKSQYRINVDTIGEFSMPLNCRHCKESPCLKVCPTSALFRENEDSPVLLDPDKCIGCKYCILACPFGVIKLSSSKKAVIKCDLCIERLKIDELPACVSSCPTKALKFKPVEEITEIDRKDSIEYEWRIHSSRSK